MVSSQFVSSANSTDSESIPDEQIAMTENVNDVTFDYFLSNHAFPRGLHIQEWFSYIFPPYFSFFRISIFEQILDQTNIFYALVSSDFQTLVFVPAFEHTRSVRFVQVFIYQNKLYELFYKVFDILPPASISVPFLLVFLVQQILINFLAFQTVPFCPTTSKFTFHDKKGRYSNVYFTPSYLSQVFWLIRTDFFPNCSHLIDVAQGNYHSSLHFSMYDFPWSFAFFLNGNFGLGNLFVPQSGIIPVPKVVSQDELFNNKGYIIVSFLLSFFLKFRCLVNFWFVITFLVLSFYFHFFAKLFFLPLTLF